MASSFSGSGSGSGGMLSAGRFCYLIAIVVAALAVVQNHSNMQQEIDLNRRSRDQFEQFYEGVLEQEAEWRGRFERESLRCGTIEERLHKALERAGEAGDLPQDSTQSRDDLFEQLSAAKSELDDLAREKEKLEGELRQKNLELQSAKSQFQQAEAELHKMQDLTERNGKNSTASRLSRP